MNFVHILRPTSIKGCDDVFLTERWHTFLLTHAGIKIHFTYHYFKTPDFGTDCHLMPVNFGGDSVIKTVKRKMHFGMDRFILK